MLVKVLEGVSGVLMKNVTFVVNLMKQRKIVKNSYITDKRRWMSVDHQTVPVLYAQKDELVFVIEIVMLVAYTVKNKNNLKNNIY